MSDSDPLEDLHGMAIEHDDGEAPNDSTAKSPTEVVKDAERSAEGESLNKLPTRRAPHSIKMFDPKLANLYVSKKKWDALKLYFGRFGSKDSKDSVNLLIELEQHVIELIQDDKYVAALSHFKDVIIPTIRDSASIEMIKPLIDHLLFLEKEVKASISIFDEDIANAFINEKNLKGLKEYLKVFIENNPHDGVNHDSPGLDLTLYELELTEAVENDESSFQFAHKENASARPHCMACGWVLPPAKGPKTFEYHITRSEECKKSHVNKCDGVTPYLSRLLSACKNIEKAGTSSGSGALVFITASSKESNPSGKRRKVFDESESGSLKGESISAVKELTEDNPGNFIVTLVASNYDLCMDLGEVDSSVRAEVSAICMDQRAIIFDLTGVIPKEQTDLICLERGLQTGEEECSIFPFNQCLASSIPLKSVGFC